MILLPAIADLLIPALTEKPSKTGTVCEIPSPVSQTTPVVLPFEYNESTACTAT